MPGGVEKLIREGGGEFIWQPRVRDTSITPTSASTSTNAVASIMSGMRCS